MTYHSSIKHLVTSLQKKGWNTTGCVLGTFLTEPFQSLKAGFLKPLGWKSHFDFYNLNPTTLTDEQKRQNPILLLNGDSHNQSAWLALAPKLPSTRAVFTVNTLNGENDEENFLLIPKKMKEIASLFGRDVKFDLVGHSNGGDVAHKLARRPATKDLINKIILVGMVTKELPESPLVYEIVGKHDVILPTPSQRPPTHQKIIHCGHLGLLYNEESHNQILQWLNS